MNKKGNITRLELIILLVIGIEVIYFIFSSYGWLDNHMSLGNDALYVNTAESVAKVNSLDGVDCPVNECEKGNINCTHHTSEGYIGYFDSISNTIVGYKPQGYNSSANPKIDDKTCSGEVSTMVIKVTCKDGNIILDWVRGNNE